MTAPGAPRGLTALLFGPAVVAAALAASCRTEEPRADAARTGTAPKASTAAASHATRAPESPASRDPRVGRWSGRYRAKRGSVTVPPGVRYDAWKGDDSSEATGDGTIALDVAEGGDISGSASGPLGELRLRGMLDDEVLRAGLVPADPSGPGAMTGVLTGVFRGDRIEVVLRASGPDGRLVREAEARLVRH